MEVKKITEGMTAPQVAEVIDSNFKGLNEEKANKAETDVKFSALSTDVLGLMTKSLNTPLGGQMRPGYAINWNNGSYFQKENYTTGLFKVYKGSEVVVLTEGKLNKLLNYAIYTEYGIGTSVFVKGGESVGEFVTIPNENDYYYLAVTYEGNIKDYTAFLKKPYVITVPNYATNFNNGKYFEAQGWTSCETIIDKGQMLRITADNEYKKPMRYSLYSGTKFNLANFIKGEALIGSILEIPSDYDDYYLIVSYQGEVSKFAIEVVNYDNALKSLSNDIKGINSQLLTTEVFSVTIRQNQALNYNNGVYFYKDGWTSGETLVGKGQIVRILADGEYKYPIRYALYNTNGIQTSNFIKGGESVGSLLEIPCEEDVYILVMSFEGVVNEFTVEILDVKNSFLALSKDIDKANGKLYGIDTEANTSRNILWLGTSIPHSTPYPQEVCSILGYTCYNMALGSSGLCLNRGILGNGRDCYDLSESTAEKHERYDAYIGTSSYITTARIEAGGYDKRIIPYIDGTIASCDTVVFDHGYNDRLQIFNEMKNFDSINKSMFGEIDRTTYIGAFVFLLKKIWEVNPNIKIFICSYLESQSDENCPVGTDAPKLGKYICEYQKKIADYFNFVYLPMCEYNGFHTHLVSGTDNYLKTNYGNSYDIINYYNENNPNNCISLWQYYCPDGIHPHTDKFGRGKERIVNSLVKLMKNL